MDVTLDVNLQGPTLFQGRQRARSRPAVVFARQLNNNLGTSLSPPTLGKQTVLNIVMAPNKRPRTVTVTETAPPTNNILAVLTDELFVSIAATLSIKDLCHLSCVCKFFATKSIAAPPVKKPAVGGASAARRACKPHYCIDLCPSN